MILNATHIKPGLYYVEVHDRYGNTLEPASPLPTLQQAKAAMEYFVKESNAPHVAFIATRNPTTRVITITRYVTDLETRQMIATLESTLTPYTPTTIGTAPMGCLLALLILALTTLTSAFLR